jgi:hypothetical protein
VYGETWHLQRNEYQIEIPYRDDAELDKIVCEPLYEIGWGAPGDRQGVGGASPLR